MWLRRGCWAFRSFPGNGAWKVDCLVIREICDHELRAELRGSQPTCLFVFFSIQACGCLIVFPVTRLTMYRVRSTEYRFPLLCAGPGTRSMIYHCVSLGSLRCLSVSRKTIICLGLLSVPVTPFPPSKFPAPRASIDPLAARFRTFKDYYYQWI